MKEYCKKIGQNNKCAAATMSTCTPKEFVEALKNDPISKEHDQRVIKFLMLYEPK